MKTKVRHIIETILGALLAACMICAFVAGKESRTDLRCTGIVIEITDSVENSFVSVADINRYLDREYGAYIGEPIDSLDLTRMERIIDGRSAVMKSEAFVTRDGLLHIKVNQRKPIVRFQVQGGGFYADADGFIFPLQSSYSSHVQVVDGEIPIAANSGYKGKIEDPQQEKWLMDVLAVVRHIDESRIWKGKIVQISASGNGELTLIPRVGQERFLFGQPSCIEEKFRKMEKYYTTIVPEKGKEYYRYVDLRFKDQIVCRQK